MTPDPPATGPFVWATRGRSWGFRIVRSAGVDDPLAVYEGAFADLGEQPELWRPSEGGAALRFPDPEGRRDAAGRTIPHEFVLVGRWAHDLGALADARARLWSEVAEEYDRIWAAPEPPRPA